MVTERRARSLMILGTASSVGKSMLVTALCRIFANRGTDVAPFKAQNMSLNSAATPDGFEIGRSQALQAEAARRPPIVEMNPVLLKPTGGFGTQVVLDGTIFNGDRAAIFPSVLAAYERLAAMCDLVVLEGAGSPVEINLRDRDIVNMRMAIAADAPCLLVGDIDRGGVFASLLGTLELMEPDERRLVRGFAVNKFRGDRSLLQPGIEEMERRLGIPCRGVIPWIDDLNLDEEDSCGVVRSRAAWASAGGTARRLRVAIVELPSLANATDFAALCTEPDVEARWVRRADELHGADAVIVPGSKHTIGDLRWLRARGLDRAIADHATRQKPTIGICGGLQILGEHVADPSGVESGGAVAGLGLLPLATTLSARKTTIAVRGRLASDVLFGATIETRDFGGYEIHVGVSKATRACRHFATLRRNGGDLVQDGAVSADGFTVGTYVHGLFDYDVFRHELIDALRKSCGLLPARTRVDFTAARDVRIERLARIVGENIDVDAMLA